MQDEQTKARSLEQPFDGVFQYAFHVKPQLPLQQDTGNGAFQQDSKGDPLVGSDGTCIEGVAQLVCADRDAFLQLFQHGPLPPGLERFQQHLGRLGGKGFKLPLTPKL